MEDGLNRIRREHVADHEQLQASLSQHRHRLDSIAGEAAATGTVHRDIGRMEAELSQLRAQVERMSLSFDEQDAAVELAKSRLNSVAGSVKELAGRLDHVEAKGAQLTVALQDSDRCSAAFMRLVTNHLAPG